MHALLDILILLIAAKLAAEGAERIGLPPVVGEIVAGVLIGPSLFNLVKPSDILTVLGEVGVILLLLEVGLEMDLAELGAVGRAAMSVAVIGVIVPFAAGFGVGLAFGWETNEAIFVGAALTATSVGISARVFGDLKALATVEARTVLGAAVADDVLGLIILTVVVRLVEAGSVSVVDVAKISFVAVAFLVVSILVGIRFVPPVFAAISKHSRSAGTLVALALAFALGVAELASAAKLAPIVGAFVAGIALARAPVADRVRRELAPVGHLFVPVFFLQIGIDTDIHQFFKPSVLGVAAVLLAIGVAGKLVASAGLIGAPGDRLLVGIGMIPRGEVGLIFATIGLQNKVFGEDIYAALLLMVLLSTLITPPLLRMRLLQVRKARPTAIDADAPVPPGGWLRVTDGVVDIAAVPPAEQALLVALRAALLGEAHRPGAALLDWLGNLPDEPLSWDEPSRGALLEVLERGGPRSWRFLAITAVLSRALPELDAAMGRRASDAFDLDPAGALRWPRLARLRELGALDSLPDRDAVALAAVILDASAGSDDRPERLAAAIMGRLGFPIVTVDRVVRLVGDADLLVGAARRIDGFDRDVVTQLADHLGDSEHVRSLGWLVRSRDDLDAQDRVAVGELHDLLIDVLGRSWSLPSQGSARQRRTAAISLVEDPLVRDTLAQAPSSYVVTQTPTALARQARLCSPTPRGDTVRVGTTIVGEDRWRIEIAAADRIGLLAHMARMLGSLGLDVVDATTAVWPDGCALVVFTVASAAVPSVRRFESTLLDDLHEPLETAPAPDVEVQFDDEASPWNTLCRVEAPDRAGLLAAITAAFAAAEANVHSCRVATIDGTAVDQFELSGPNGAKLSDAAKDAIRSALLAGVTAGRRGRIRIRA